MKLSNQNICNLRGCQMPLGGCNLFLGGAHPPAPLQKIRAWCLTLNQFPQTFLANPSKLRIYPCKIPTVITETLIV
jgi:hypothetical protein